MHSRFGRRALLWAVGAVVSISLAPVTVSAHTGGSEGKTRDGDTAADGAFTCDFALGPTAFEGSLPAVIERDRMYMTAQPGMLHKHIPFRPDPMAATDGGVAYSGGRYLFDSRRHARDYEDFVKHQFTLDGVQFLARDYFQNPTCRSWDVVGAHDFASLDHQLILRTEWMATGAAATKLLQSRWPAVRAEAQRRGDTAVWLLARPDADLAAIVSFRDRVAPDAVGLDVAGLALFEAAPPLSDLFADQGWGRTFDRTEWALTIWYPFAKGDHGRPALWPYAALPSPERPGPDGLCEPSRGESYRTAPNECLPSCGDGKPQRKEGETTATCPSDVPWTDTP